MLRSLFLLAVLCMVVHDVRITKACHAGHTKKPTEENDYEYYDYDDDDDDDENGKKVQGVLSNETNGNKAASRAKRQIQQYGDDYEALRKYFRACMLDKSSEEWDWKSVVDFSILKTLWFLYSGTVECTEESEKDDAKCWKGCIDVYLRATSSLINPAKDCVDQCQKDFLAGRAEYLPKNRKVEKSTPEPQDKYSECVQAQYNEADPSSLLQDSGILSVPAESEMDITAITAFVRKNVLCTLCDFSSLPSGLSQSNVVEIDDRDRLDGSAVYSVTWPFSLEALVRKDARLRLALNFCNKELEGTFRKDPPPNPGWTQWFTWANCDAVCGGSGTQKRSRVCLDESQRNCYGPKFESRVCHNRNCAHWSNWGPYTPCISTCDLSERYSFRYCVKGKIGGEGCIGERRRSKSCAVSSCEVPWSQWSLCSATCGGGGFQHRTGGRSLLETKIETRPCVLGACPQQWTLWSPWGPCSKTCGPDGKRQRLRECASSTPCTGPSVQFAACVEHHLPCQDQWGEWSPWSGCVYRKRNRICRGWYGAQCSGGGEDYQKCFATDFKTTTSPAHWSPWSVWSSCSPTCGRGNQLRIRECRGTNSQYPGACAGKNVQVENCSNTPCYAEVKSLCSDDHGWEGHCNNIDCQGQYGSTYCKKTCGYC